MPVVMFFLRGLWLLLPQLVMHLLVAIGVGTATYLGVGALFDFALGEIQTKFAAMPVQAIQLLNVCGVDNYISILFSAMTIRLTLTGLTAAGALKKVYWTGGSPIVLN